jgi:glucosamine--fructose-6-phosphate aminotransferase (isomerizing)
MNQNQPRSEPVSTAMARETAEAPEAVARMLDRNRDALAEVGRLFRKRNPAFIATCARGSSDHAASYLKYLSEIELGLPCCPLGASVVSIYAARLNLRDSILITVSQSGRSPDILSLQQEARRAGIPALAITNEEASPLAREADLCLPLSAGVETSITATKTFVASAAMAAAIVANCGGDEGFAQVVNSLPGALEKALAIAWDAAEAMIAPASSLYVLGRGPSFPIAQEAALKLKESSGLHAEAYSAAEILHGPMELVTDGFPILVFAADDAARGTTAAAMARLSEAGGHILATGDGLAYSRTGHPHLDPIAMILTFYRSAERIARQRGRDPDRPRLLKKVTETR